jgi:hypothetical protein
MTALRILNVVVYGMMAVYMFPGAWSAVFGRDVRRGDPMRLACFATAFVMLGFNLRWLFAPDSIWMWQALYLLSAGVGVYIIVLAHAYGRGGRVG